MRLSSLGNQGDYGPIESQSERKEEREEEWCKHQLDWEKYMEDKGLILEMETLPGDKIVLTCTVCHKTVDL